MRTCVLGGAVAGGRAHGVVHAAWTRGAAGVPRRHAAVNAATFARQRLWSLFCVCLLSININVFVLHVDSRSLILMPVLCRHDAVGYSQRQGLAELDTALLTDQEVENVLQQVNVINRMRAHCLELGCVWHDVGRLRAATAANAYLDIHPLYVYKP